MDIETTFSTFAANRSHFAPLVKLGGTYYEPGHAVLTEDFLQWLYIDNPAGPATLIVALEGELWIGLIVLIPVMLECSGRPQPACYAVNVLTHPEHRGKNLFVKMIDHARIYLSERKIWLLGHPNANAVPGWKRKKMSFRLPLNLYMAKFRLPFSPVRHHRVLDRAQLQSIPPAFWDGLAARTDVHVKYSADYIAWRFLDAPHRKYVVQAATKDHEVLGLSVSRHFKGPFDLLVDFVATPLALAGVLPSSWRPTLVLHPGAGDTSAGITKHCWKLPVSRQFPFFVTQWDQEAGGDMSGITLAASDF